MRWATPLDAEAMERIHADAGPPGAAWQAKDFAAQLALPGVFGLIDRRGGMILARVAVDEAEILTLAVAPLARRRGLGRTLLVGAMEAARTRGARAMFLEVSAENRPALALYERVGFQRAGRRARYYADGADALVLCTKISVDAAHVA